jgi:ABC-type nitrate/sulfonate/bicarbonate transport system substrate-binding protein
MVSRSLSRYVLGLLAISVIWFSCLTPARAQEAKPKLRISNSAMSVTSLGLLAAREWKFFQDGGLNVEIILMSPALTVPAMISGEIDYFAGVGPGVVSASLSGMPFRAVWVSSDKVSYSLMANAKFKTVQELKGKKIGVTGSLGATNHVSLVIALEKLGMSAKDFNILALPPQEMLRSLESGFLDAPPRSIRRRCSWPRKKVLPTFSISARWWRCPAVASRSLPRTSKVNPTRSSG